MRTATTSALALLSLGAVAWGAAALHDAWRAAQKREATAPPVAARPRPAPSAAPAPEEPAGKLIDPRVDDAAARAAARPRLARPALPEKPGVRRVRTPVTGPQNARVRIDGRLVPWFQNHELSVGPHTFEFVPPNSECCEAPPPQTVEITAGEDVQTVRGVISFRSATLRFEASRGSGASCGIGGILQPGEARDIPMDRPVRRLTCTIVPPPGTGAAPAQSEVELRPGRTFTLTGS